jgi:biphenyl 2,3-dioxygenase subunit beta
MPPELQIQIAQFLYREARFLDERRFREWYDLFTDDVKYWMPLRLSRFAKGTRAIKAVAGREVVEDTTTEHEMAFMDETKTSLRMRIERVETGMAWAEEPPSRTRHLITNVEVDERDEAGNLTVYSNFAVFRSHLDVEEDCIIGHRKDLLRPHGDSWQIASRTIVLIHNVVQAKNMSMFF